MNFLKNVALLMLCLCANISDTYCADDSRALTFVDIAARKVEQVTLLPQVLAKLVVEYDGGRKFGLKKQLSPESFDSQQTVLACGLLACVLYDGTLIKKNLATNEVVEERQLFTPEEKEIYCVKHPLTALPDGHLAIPVNRRNSELNGMIKVVHPTNNGSFNIPLSAVTEPEQYRFTLLPNNELVVYTAIRALQDVFDIQTGERKRWMNYSKHGCCDIVLLGDTVATSGISDIVLSDLRAPLEGCSWNPEILIHHAARTLDIQKYTIDRLAALSEDKLVLAARESHSNNAYLILLKLKKTHASYKSLKLPDAHGLELVALSSNTVAARTHPSGKTIIVEFGENDAFTSNILPAARPAKAIQGLPNSDLFVQLATGENTVWGTSLDMSFYEQAGGKQKKKKAWVLV